MTIRPSLKSGTFIHPLATSAEVRVGTRWRFCSLPSTWSGVPTRALIELCDGANSLAEIASKSGISLVAVESLIAELCKHDLVDTAKTPISYLRRYNSELGRIDAVTSLDDVTKDFAIETALKRIEMECEGATFNPGDIDGGRSAVLRRRDFNLIIFGYGKIVNNLVGTLSASGFSNILVINRVGTKDPTQKILESDIAGGYVTRSHLGQPRRTIVEEIRERSLLFAEPRTPFHSPDLIISIGDPTPDSLQRWMADNSPHLLVDVGSSSEVRIGPYVIPGKSPCFRCIHIAESREWIFTTTPDISSALALSVAGAIAHDVIALSDRQTSIYLGTSHIHSSRNYSHPEIQHWSQHHACGCSWGG
jgi:hypothetical protein